MKRLMLISGFLWGVTVSHVKDVTYLIISSTMIGFLVIHFFIVGIQDSNHPDVSR